mgnify:CR=1 FL=1
MNIIETNIEGVLIIEPRLFRDSRGYFFESFSAREFEEKVASNSGHSAYFCQDNESMSSYDLKSNNNIRENLTSKNIYESIKDNTSRCFAPAMSCCYLPRGMA